MDTKPLFPDGGTMYENWFYILVFPMGYYATLFPDEGTMYANYTVYHVL
jgi:hypothetical protein